MNPILSLLLSIWNFVLVFLIQPTLKENLDVILVFLSIVLTLFAIIKISLDIYKKLKGKK